MNGKIEPNYGRGSIPEPTCTTDHEQSQVTEWLNRLMQRSEEAYELNCRIESKLEPVLRNEPKQPETQGTEQEQLVLLADRMRNVANMIQHVLTDQRSILDRLEL